MVALSIDLPVTSSHIQEAKESVEFYWIPGKLQSTKTSTSNDLFREVIPLTTRACSSKISEVQYVGIQTAPTINLNCLFATFTNSCSKPRLLICRANKLFTHCYKAASASCIDQVESIAVTPMGNISLKCKLRCIKFIKPPGFRENADVWFVRAE